VEGIFTEGLPLTEEPPTHAPRAMIPMLLSQAHRPRIRDELPALPSLGELLRSDDSPFAPYYTITHPLRYNPYIPTLR